MDDWLKLQNEPSQRFKPQHKWTDKSVSSQRLEENILKINIQDYLRKLISDIPKDEQTGITLTSGELVIFRKTLMDYSNKQKSSTGYHAMNLQANQLDDVIEILKAKDRYMRDVKEKEKVLCELSKSKNLKAKGMDAFENKLKNVIDSIDVGNTVSNLDTIIKPYVQEIEDEAMILKQGLYNETDGVVHSDMVQAIKSCMPADFNETNKANIFTEWEKSCYNNPL